MTSKRSPLAATSQKRHPCEAMVQGQYKYALCGFVIVTCLAVQANGAHVCCDLQVPNSSAKRRLCIFCRLSLMTWSISSRQIPISKGNWGTADASL